MPAKHQTVQVAIGQSALPVGELVYSKEGRREFSAFTKETAADLKYRRGRGTSLGGMRPKCSVQDDDGHLAIGKFPSVQDDRSVTRGEVLALQLAATAGIRVAESRIVMSEDIEAFIPAFENPQMQRAAQLIG